MGIRLECDRGLGGEKGMNLQASTLKTDETGEPSTLSKLLRSRLRDAWKEAGCAREPRFSVSRNIVALIDDRDCAFWGNGGEDQDPVGFIDPTRRSIFRKIYCPHPVARSARRVLTMDNYPIHAGVSRRREFDRSSGSGLQIATFPGNRIGAVFPRLSPLFPEAGAAPNILYTGFTNANAMLHVANCVTNAGRIESGDSYKFYAVGVTPAVARLYEAINSERVAAAAALGASVPSLADWFDRAYGVREATLVETCQRLTYNSDGPYQATSTPKSLDHKFITEDVPTGLIPMSALGAAASSLSCRKLGSVFGDCANRTRRPDLE